MGKRIKKTKGSQEKNSENNNSSPHIQQQSIHSNNDPSRKQSDFRQDYFLHGCPEQPKSFPIHRYFTNSRKAQLLKYCQLYFDPILKQSACEEEVIPNHLNQILNSSIDLCYRLPDNAVAFLLIRELDERRVLMKLCNMHRQIFCYEIFEKNVSVNEKVMNFKKSFKLKGSQFIFILDMCPEMDNNKYDRKFFKSLQNCFWFIYCKNNLSQKQQHHFLNIESSTQNDSISFEIDINKNKLWVYPISTHSCPSIEKLIQSKAQLQERTLSFQREHQDFFTKNSNSLAFGRLYTYDIMMYNYTQAYDKPIEYFLKYITRRMQSNVASANQSQDAQNNHFPDRILHSKRCKNCEIMGVTTNKKSKYICISCTQKYNADVPLCVVGCFAQFHQKVLLVVEDCKLKDMKKVYEHRLKQKEEQKKKEFEKELEEKRADPYRIVKDVKEAEKFNELFKTYNKMNELLKALGEIEGTEQIQKNHVSYMYIRNLQATELLKKKKAEIEEFRHRQQFEMIKRENDLKKKKGIKIEHEQQLQANRKDVI